MTVHYQAVHVSTWQAVVAWIIGASCVLAAIHNSAKRFYAAEEELRQRNSERAHA